MAIDPRISLGVQPMQIPDPLAQYGKIAAIQQAQNQNALAQYQLGAAQREEAKVNALGEAYRAAYNPQTGEIDTNALRKTLAASGQGAQLPAVEKALGELETQKLTREKSFGELVKNRMELSRARLDTVRTPDEYLAWHESNHTDPVLSKYFGQLGVTADQSRAQIVQKLQQPGGFQELLLGSALGLEKASKQHFVTQNLGGTTQVLSQPEHQIPGMPSKATVVPGSVAQVTMTPAEKANVGLRQQELNLKRETEKRLASAGVAGTDALVAQAIRDGRLDLSQVTSKNRSIIASTLAENPEHDFKVSGIEFAGAKAGARTLGTSEANIVQAANEAQSMIGIVRDYAPKINPSNYPALNAAGNYVAKNTGDPAQVGMATALNSLVNTYARAINPRGTPTKSDKDHAREILNMNMSSGQINEALRVMQLEMDASLASPVKARKSLGYTKEEAGVPGQRKPTPSASKAPGGVDQAIWDVMTPQERALWQK